MQGGFHSLEGGSPLAAEASHRRCPLQGSKYWLIEEFQSARCLDESLELYFLLPENIFKKNAFRDEVELVGLF